jgi:YesN/AraC family two-component response regulator
MIVRRRSARRHGRRQGRMFDLSRNKLVIRFVIPYLCILMIPLITGYLIYERTIALLEEEVTRNNMSILEQSKYTLNSRLAEVENLGRKLAGDTKVIRFQHMTNPKHADNIYTVIETIKRLKEYNLSHPFIVKFFIMYKQSEVVLDPVGMFSYREYYDFMNRPVDLEFAEWVRTMMEPYYHRHYFPAQSIVYDKKPNSFIIYAQSMGYPKYSLGTVFILIDEAAVANLLSGVDVSAGGWAYIADEAGNIITGYAGAGTELGSIALPSSRDKGVFRQVVDGQDMLVTYTKSEYDGWLYVAVQPSKIILQKVDYIRELTFTLFFVSLFLGILLSFLLAYRGSMPIRRLVGTILEYDGKDFPKARDVYRFLRTSVAGIIHNNSMLQEKIGRQLPFLQASLTERLLRGDFVHEEDLKAYLDHAGLVIQARHYAVAILQFRGFHNQINQDILDELSVKRMQFREKLQQLFAGRIYIHEANEDQLILLLMCDEVTPEGCKIKNVLLFRRMANELQTAINVRFVVALGSFQDNRMDISRSYDEAKQALGYAAHYPREAVLVYEDIPRSGEKYYFPNDMETRLTNLTRAGEWERVREYLAELEVQNFVRRQLPPDMLRLFVYEVYGSLVKLSQEWPQGDEGIDSRINDTVKRMESYEDCLAAFELLKETFRRICESADSRKKSRNERLLRRVVECVQASLYSESLTLAQVAEQIQVSEVYLSQFFKEQMGETFTAYLERNRMEKALQLLNETEIPVKDIAAMVGYSSSNTFGRAFKRVYGMSAMAYRTTARSNPTVE